MKKLCLFVANNYTFDSRVQRLANSYSKVYEVVVIGITNSKCDLPVEVINKNLKIKRIFVKWPINNINMLLFGQKLFKNIISKEKPDICHCCDPDTMIAGIYSKKLFNSKIIYDSHELWSDVSRREKFYYILYSFIYSKLYYLLERKYIAYFDKVITVSEPIKNILQSRYNLKNIIVIENRCNYIKLDKKTLSNTCVFIGGERTDVINKILLIKDKFNYKTKVLGFKKNISGIKFRGKILPKYFKKELLDSKIGLCIYGNDCKSVYYATPNKLFQYVQYELPVIAPNYPGLQKIKQYNLGVLYNDKKDFLIKFSKLINNYNFYLNNIKKYKKELSWEVQERLLL